LGVDTKQQVANREQKQSALVAGIGAATVAKSGCYFSKVWAAILFKFGLLHWQI